jgi:hypothetical protein
MRDQVQAFTVLEDTCVAVGRAIGNKRFGEGGGTQFYISPIDRAQVLPVGKPIQLS